MHSVVARPISGVWYTKCSTEQCYVCTFKPSVLALYSLGVVRSILGRVAQQNFFRDFSSPTIVVPGVRMVTVGAKSKYNGCGVKKNLDHSFVS